MNNERKQLPCHGKVGSYRLVHKDDKKLWQVFGLRSVFSEVGSEIGDMFSYQVNLIYTQEYGSSEASGEWWWSDNTTLTIYAGRYLFTEDDEVYRVYQAQIFSDGIEYLRALVKLRLEPLRDPDFLIPL